MNNIFFFSQRCEFCREAYSIIKQIGVDKFNLIDVDVSENNPPQSINRVPCVINNENEIYFDEELFTYLNEMLNIEPFMVNEMGSTLSDKYSYVNESGVNLDHSFQFLDKDTKINTPSEADTNKIISYDDYISQRDKDLKMIHK